MVFEPFRFDAVNQCLWRGKARVDLQPKPFAVLGYLIAHAGRLVTQDEILTAVWPDIYVHPDVIRQYIHEIRRTLGDDAATPRFIRTFPKRGYQFIAPVTAVAARSDGSAIGAAPLFVGRESALADLRRTLQEAQLGSRQVVFVTGEAGIGKTSLMDAFQREVESKGGVQLARGHSIEGFGGKEAHYPIFAALGQLGRSAAAFFRPDRKVRDLSEAIEATTQAGPLVLILEDLHWADDSTLDVISAIARRRDSSALLLIGTFRPADAIIAGSPVKTLTQDLVLHRLAAEVRLERLSEADLVTYVAERFATGTLREDVAKLLYRYSDGNPLFMTALADHLVAEGILVQHYGSWRSSVSFETVELGIPDTLKQMLELQLRHLAPAHRRLLACASVVGPRFTTVALATVLDEPLAEVEARCALLIEQQQFVRVCGTCRLPNGDSTTELAFTHALYRDILYAGLNRSERIALQQCLSGDLDAVRPTRDIDPAVACAV